MWTSHDCVKHKAPYILHFTTTVQLDLYTACTSIYTLQFDVLMTYQSHESSEEKEEESEEEESEEEESINVGGSSSEEESMGNTSRAHRVKGMRQCDLVRIVSAHSIRFSRCHLCTCFKAFMLRRLWARRLQSSHAWRMSLRLVCVSFQAVKFKKQEVCM